MWRRSAFGNAQENEDSDQSISEDEGLGGGGWTDKAISLSGAADNNKGGMQVLSQLEILEDCYEHHPANNVSISSHERKIGFCGDDEVENPFFNDEDDSFHYSRITSNYHSHEGLIFLPTMASITNSEEEIISDNERVSPPIKSARADVSSTWSAASREVKALVCLHKNCGSSSSDGVTLKANNYYKGGVRAKNKPKFSFHLQSRKEDQSLLVDDQNRRKFVDSIPLPDAIGDMFHNDRDKFMTESQLVVQGNEAELPGDDIEHHEVSQKYYFKEHSISESLVCFHESSGPMQGSLETDVDTRGIRAQIVADRYTSPKYNEFLDADDPSDALDSGSSSEDELIQENHQRLESIIPRTLADQFHEVFGAVSVKDERPHLASSRPFGGLFEKLQQVMQSEKERDMDQLKNSSAETNSTDLCISVRILSRSLEAKLTVCSCTYVGDSENSRLSKLQMKSKSEGRTLSIIFSSRMYSNVDLEVGNLIRIYPPWKEVPVIGKDEVVILCSYFSQLQS